MTVRVMMRVYNRVPTPEITGGGNGASQSDNFMSKEHTNYNKIIEFLLTLESWETQKNMDNYRVALFITTALSAS